MDAYAPNLTDKRCRIPVDVPAKRRAVSGILVIVVKMACTDL